MTQPTSESGILSRSVTFQDMTASLVSLVLVIGLLVLAFLDRPIPPSLTVALGSATTWLFIRAAIVRPGGPGLASIEKAEGAHTHKPEEIVPAPENPLSP